MPRKKKAKEILQKPVEAVAQEIKTINKYDAPFYKIVPTAIFGAAGLFYMLVPSEIITEIGLGFKEGPEGHTTFGIVFLMIAGVFWLVNHRKRK